MPGIIDSDSLLEIIHTAASGPEEVQGDAGRVKQYALADLIAAHKYLATAEAAGDTPRTSGLRFAQLVPGGTVQRGYRPWR